MGEGSRALGGALMFLFQVQVLPRKMNGWKLRIWAPQTIIFRFDSSIFRGVVSFQTKFGLGFWKVYLDLPMGGC